MVAPDVHRLPDRAVGSSAPAPTDEALALAQLVRALRTLTGVSELVAVRTALEDNTASNRALEQVLRDRTAKLDPEQLAFTAKEAAGMLGVSPGTVHKLVREGALPTTEIDSVRRFSINDLRAFLARQRAYRALADAESIEREGGRPPLDPVTRNAAIKDLAQDALERRRARRVGRRGEHGDGVVNFTSARRRHASRVKGDER